MTNLKSTVDPKTYSNFQLTYLRQGPLTTPLSITLEVTEYFLSETSSLQSQLALLSRVLGHEVIVEADWQRLLDEFGEQQEPTLVGAARDIVVAWCIELYLILVHPESDDWLTKLLTCLVEVNGKLRVMLGVWENNQVGTSWSDERNGFFVHLPKHFLFVRRALYRGTSVIRGEFKKSLLSCFAATAKDKEDSKPEPRKGAWTGTATEATESWLKQFSVRDEESGGERSSAAAVATDAAGATPAAACKTKPTTANSKTTTTSSASSTQPKPSRFPTVASLPSISEICSKPPYHITIQDTSKPGWISIEGSHGSSLKLIDQYISKWTPDVVMESEDKPPTIVIVVNGALSTLTVRKMVQGGMAKRRQSVTVPMVLAIVEGTLGYEVVWQGSGEYRLRRDAPFVYE